MEEHHARSRSTTTRCGCERMVIKLGKYEKPLETKELEKQLKKAKGLIMFVFKEKQVYIVTHGHLDAEQFGNAFGTCMERTFKMPIKILTFDPTVKDPTKGYAA